MRSADGPPLDPTESTVPRPVERYRKLSISAVCSQGLAHPQTRPNSSGLLPMAVPSDRRGLATKIRKGVGKEGKEGERRVKGEVSFPSQALPGKAQAPAKHAEYVLISIGSPSGRWDGMRWMGWMDGGNKRQTGLIVTGA